LKKAAEYRRHAAECRVLARSAHNVEHRNQLLIMAETWDSLASERERAIAVSPKSGQLTD
jgi:hypothetical protein